MTAIDPTDGMTYLEKIEYWGGKVATSRSPKQFDEARRKYNELVSDFTGQPNID
jgi:hypothetical protein